MARSPPFARDDEGDWFTFYLARELHMTVGELLASMDVREYNRWVAFYRLEAERRDRAQQRARRKG